MIANKNCVKDYSGRAYLVQNYPLIDSMLESAKAGSVKEHKRPLLVYVGGVAETRGALVYVRLAHELVRRGREFKIMLIGPYSAQEGDRLKRTIEELDVGQNVELTGRMEWRKAMQIVSKAKIGLCLLLPIGNYTTCLATKILEYMMMGTAVLASDFEVWRPFVVGEKSGMMVDPTDVSAAADACERMLESPEELKLMEQRGQQAVRDKYNWDREFQQLLKCYRDMIGSGE